MRKMKDSGIEWVGEIPEHWTLSKIKHAYQFETGFTPSTSKLEYYSNEGYDWATIADMNGTEIIDTKLKITEKAIRELKPSIVRKGTLLFSFKLSIGQVAFAGKDMYTNEAIACFSPENKNSINYLYYSGPLFIVKNSNTNIYGAKLLNQQLINEAKIILPPLEEQQRIANFLDDKTSKIDSLITTKGKQIELLNEYKQSLISETVTKGLNPNVKMKDSGVEWIGEIPEHWKLSKLGYFYGIDSGYAFKSDEFDNKSDIPIVRMSNLKSGLLSLDDVKRVKMKNEYEAFLLKAGDFIFGMSGSLDNYAIVNKEDLPALLNQRVGRFTLVDSKNASYLYVKYLFLSEPYKKGISDIATGTAQLNVSVEDVLNIKMPFPPIKEQKQIIEFLDHKTSKIDSLINQIQNEIDKLKEYRESIIFEVVTGKLDI